MIPVDIYAGFLGAGKTTLIKKMLKEAYAGQKVMLIENEFGEVGIDGARFAEGELTVSEIDSGCICCSLSGDFTRALEDAVTRYRPDRVVIEPSGVAKMSDVKQAVALASRTTGGLRLNACIAVADALRVKTRLDEYAEYYDDQLKNASLIALSRTQNLGEARVTEAMNLIRELNPDAVIVTTPWDALNGTDLLTEAENAFYGADKLYCELAESILPGAGAHAHHHHHHGHGAEELFNSFGAETPKRYTRQAIATLMGELASGRYGAVLRAKGMVDGGEEGFLCFDYVPGEQTVEPCPAELTGRICVIGMGLDRRALAPLFGVKEDC